MKYSLVAKIVFNFSKLNKIDPLGFKKGVLFFYKGPTNDIYILYKIDVAYQHSNPFHPNHILPHCFHHHMLDLQYTQSQDNLKIMKFLGIFALFFKKHGFEISSI